MPATPPMAVSRHLRGRRDEALTRLRAYREPAKVDWVQLESPHSVDEIKLARAAVDGPFSFMKGRLGRYLGLDEHLALGVTDRLVSRLHASCNLGGAVGLHDRVSGARRR